MVYRLVLSECTLSSQSKNIQLNGNVSRVVFILEGIAVIREGSGTESTLSKNSAIYSNNTLEISYEGIKSVILIWEVLHDLYPPSQCISEIYNDVTKKLESEINLQSEGAYLIRCDMVDFPLGGIAYTHTHKGPGIRYLMSGSLDVTVNGETAHILPHQAWFETGPQHVYAVSSETVLTSFVRVMVLPVSIKGLKSIEYVLKEDDDKPKLQQYTMFIDSDLHIK